MLASGDLISLVKIYFAFLNVFSSLFFPRLYNRVNSLP